MNTTTSMNYGTTPAQDYIVHPISVYFSSGISDSIKNDANIGVPALSNSLAGYIQKAANDLMVPLQKEIIKLKELISQQQLALQSISDEQERLESESRFNQGGYSSNGIVQFNNPKNHSPYSE